MPTVSTKRFDAGSTSEWYLCPQLDDSGAELRAKVVKAVRVTGLVTSASFAVYTFGPTEEIVVSDIEDGLNSDTGAIALTNTTLVTPSPRVQVNCPNASVHLVRVAGTWTDATAKNRIDEIEYEVAVQDSRR